MLSLGTPPPHASKRRNSKTMKRERTDFSSLSLFLVCSVCGVLVGPSFLVVVCVRLAAAATPSWGRTMGESVQNYLPWTEPQDITTQCIFGLKLQWILKNKILRRCRVFSAPSESILRRKNSTRLLNSQTKVRHSLYMPVILVSLILCTNPVLSLCPGDDDAIATKVVALIQMGKFGDGAAAAGDSPALCFERAYCLYRLGQVRSSI